MKLELCFASALDADKAPCSVRQYPSEIAIQTQQRPTTITSTASKRIAVKAQAQVTVTHGGAPACQAVRLARSAPCSHLQACAPR